MALQVNQENEVICSFHNWQSKGYNKKLTHSGLCVDIRAIKTDATGETEMASFPLDTTNDYRTVFRDNNASETVTIYICNNDSVHAPYQSAPNYLSFVVECQGWTHKRVHLICKFGKSLVKNYDLRMSNKPKYQYWYSNDWIPTNNHWKSEGVVTIYCFWHNPFKSPKSSPIWIDKQMDATPFRHLCMFLMQYDRY